MTEEIKRDYTMSDSELCMFTTNLVQTITRDATEFAARGVDALAITALNTLCGAFEIFPPDSYYQADVSLAAETKNATRADLTVKVRDVVQCAVIKWGEGSPQYKKFGAQTMTSMGDMKFLTLCRMVVTTAAGFLADLTAAGLTQAMIDAVDTGAQTFEDNMAAVNDAVEARDIKTAERITDGNALYGFVVQYCQIGKIIWDDVSEAKYNDYVIYPSTPELPGKALNMGYDMPTHTVSWDVAPKADSYQLERKFHTDPDWTVVYEGADTSVVNDPVTPGLWYFRCRAQNAEGYGTWSDELEVLMPS